MKRTIKTSKCIIKHCERLIVEHGGIIHAAKEMDISRHTLSHIITYGTCAPATEIKLKSYFKITDHD